MAAKLNTSGQIQILTPTVSKAIPPAKTVRKVNIHTAGSPVQIQYGDIEGGRSASFL